MTQQKFPATHPAEFPKYGQKIIRQQQFLGEDQKTPAEKFAPLAAVFRRRLVVGIASASLVAFGANFGGIMSSVLGLSPESGRNLKLDVIYPIDGYSRCYEPSKGFEFIYPSSWVGDRRLLYRAVERAELERSLDPPPVDDSLPPRNFTEPVVAFGPPGSSGELNVSVIVSPVPSNFSIEDFGGEKEIAEKIVKKITGKRSDITATVFDSKATQDPMSRINYYNLEFKVESPSFCRHNVAVFAAKNGRLFTINAQTPEAKWPKVQQGFYKIADSFSLIS
ncbi:psbP domain-containing protein 7, chloroplastic [Amborella trichopoda]|uniref:PsbP C-terminal domain-containing protein n=1 Tax=Amborella trichopoda TaxID=13333 RepID=U5D419_AMBTC|nr:psbP domain-containing protein 7, chloroplastic [Amborella trichopoda]ERN16980.1 hypothetical protein AMTR_s00057p00205660 [Amborella trichopoda]|eukprot:XP_006855513.1 psbP domain-containing protein 7, chloroplastic [Amborella trichopoda]